VYSLKDLEDLLGQSYEQIRNRVNELSNRFEGISETGKRNKTIVTEKGLTLLRQLKEYEDSGLSLETGLDKIEGDLDTTEEEGGNFMDTSQLEIVKTFLTKIFQENYDEPGSMDDLMFISLISGSIHKYSELFEEPEEVEQELYEHTLSEYIKVWLRIAHEKEEEVNEKAERQEAISHYESYYKENESPW